MSVIALPICFWNAPISCIHNECISHFANSELLLLSFIIVLLNRQHWAYSYSLSISFLGDILCECVSSSQNSNTCFYIYTKIFKIQVYRICICLYAYTYSKTHVMLCFLMWSYGSVLTPDAIRTFILVFRLKFQLLQLGF